MDNSFDFLVSKVQDYIPLNDEVIKMVELLFVKEQFARNHLIPKRGQQ